MTLKLRILNVEDNRNDFELTEAALKAYGIDCDLVRVETKEAFAGSLKSGLFDLILADYSLPGFDGMTALGMARNFPELPFIFVSGEIGEDLAIEALRNGATDYVFKHKLEKLGPAVQRAISEAKERADRRTAEAELRTTKEKLEKTLESISDAVFTLDRVLRITYVNTEAIKLFMRDRDRLLGASFFDICPPELEPVFQQQFEKVLRDETDVSFDALLPRLGNWVEVMAYPMDGGLSVYLHDITERKEAERRVKVTNDLLKLFARKFSLKEYLDAVVELITDWSGCRNVGIRVTDETGHIPYTASEGFTEQFLESESMLHPGTDQCICTRVISGKPEPHDLPAMTPNGSFYSNSARTFMERLAPEGRACFRGLCVRSGLVSLSVVPIRYREKILGAVHLADEREGRLPLENVEFVEKSAFIIGEAIYRFSIEEELRKNYVALKKSEERYRSLVEDVRDVIFTIRRDGAIASLSPAFESITGFQACAWIGRHFSELIHPEDFPSARELFSRILAGEIVPLFELRGLTTNGDYRHFEFKITSVRQDGGDVLGIARDITQRKLAEEDRARLVSAVESAADAVVITSPATGVIQYVNPAFTRMTGYEKEAAVGRTLHFLESGKLDDVYYAGLRERLGREGVWSGKLINRKKDGTEYFEECTVSPVYNRNGDIINYVYIKRDVTEKMRLQSIAEAVNTMNNIGYVFSGISHEIGNPVSSLSVNLEMMKEKLGSPKEELAAYIDRAMTQVEKIEFLLNSVRSFNMFEVQDLRDVKLASFIEQFLSLVSQDFTSKGITVEVAHDAEAEWVHSDPRALQQVLLNVFTNAADALEKKSCPKIVVRTAKTPGFVRIRIEDNGCGMSAEQQEKLFKPFYTTKSHGTGLGMVIIRNMLAKMGGTIEVESRRDAGTTVEITIPEGGDGKQ